MGQLSDIVSYLTSLKTDYVSCHATGSSMLSAAVTLSPIDLRNRPQPQPNGAHAFFAQTYDVLPGQYDAFETWFATRGRQ
jgi:hypothetical protein